MRAIFQGALKAIKITVLLPSVQCYAKLTWLNGIALKARSAQGSLRPLCSFVAVRTLRQSTIACALLFGVESACLSLSSVAQEVFRATDQMSLVDERKVSPSELVEQIKTLQDEIKTNARLVSLSDAIKLGLRNNPELASSFRNIQQFEWQLISAQRRWYPALQLANGTPFFGSTWDTFIQNQYALPAQQAQELRAQGQQRKSALKSQQFVVQPGAKVSWNFLDPTRQPNISAASDSLQQQKFLFDIGARDLILQIQQSYYEVQRSKQLIDSFQQIYNINQKQLEILEARMLIGMATVLDVEQTRSQLYTELSQLLTYVRNYINQVAFLAQQLGLPADQLAIPNQPAQMQGRWQIPLQETIRSATQQREEILASLAAAEAANWSSVEALRRYLPIFSLVASGNLTSRNGYQNVPVPNDPGPQYARSRQWSAAIGIGFNWLMFDGGINAADARALKAQAQQQLAQAAVTKLQVMQQVRSSYALYQTSQVAVTTARQAYRSAELAQEAARARFEVGVGDITSVVQAISQLSQAARQLSRAVLTYNTAVAELYRYSATWPGASQQEVQDRIKILRNSLEPSQANSLTRIEP